jgi:hypothetical protein
MKPTCLGIGALVAAIAASGCGEYARTGSGSTTALVALLEAAPGSDPSLVGTTLNSDVITYVKKTIGGVEVLVPTIFNDTGSATLRVEMKNPTVTAPTNASQVTSSTSARTAGTIRASTCRTRSIRPSP